MKKIVEKLLTLQKYYRIMKNVRRLSKLTNIEIGDIVKVEGNDEEWKVYWVYRDGQVELVNRYFQGYPKGTVFIGNLTLIRKGDKRL